MEIEDYLSITAMEKCRVCLKYRKNLRSLNNVDDGVTFLDMIYSITNTRLIAEPDFPSKLCLPCRRRLREAYKFKIDIERSEMVLNDAATVKKIKFDNIHDIKIDYKPVVHPLDDSINSFLCNENSITYKETVIKKIKKEDKDYIDEKRITIKEFLNSFKVESENESFDQDYELDVEYEPHSDSDDDYEKHVKLKRKHEKKYSNKNFKINKTKQSERQLALKKPIRPIILKDVKIKHTDNIIKIENKPKKKYKYPSVTSICPYCGKLFKNLSIHILTHSGERPFKCDVCSKTFLTIHILRQHKKKHTGLKEYKCDRCIAAFNCKSTLEKHMLVHSDVKKHICNICSKAFKRKSALTRHQNVHNFGTKAFECELCTRKFNSRPLLNHHMRVHTGERPYKCEICSQPYSYKHDFNRHCLKKHGVFLKLRSVYTMNEEVLQKERALMRDLALRAHGVIIGDDIPSEFKGPQGPKAFALAMKAIEARQIPTSYTETTYKLCLMFFEPTDRRKASKILHHMRMIDYASPNLSELRAMARFISPQKSTTDAKLSDIDEILQLSAKVSKFVKCLIVTLGSKGVIFIENTSALEEVNGERKIKGNIARAKLYPTDHIEKIENVSGAGDSFASGFIHGLLSGLKESHCVSVGFKAAKMTLMSKNTVSSNLNSNNLVHLDSLDYKLIK